MRTQRGGWEREGGRETLLGDGAYILNFNKITGEERVSERDRGSSQQHVASPSGGKVETVRARDSLLFSFLSGGVRCFAFIPRTLSRNIRIDQALCRRKCPAEGWTDGLWCTERRRGEQKEKKKSAGLLKTVSRFLSCLNLDPLLFPLLLSCLLRWRWKCCAVSQTTVSGFALHIPAVRCEMFCCISTGLVVHVCESRDTFYWLVLSRLGRSRPVREALTPLSLMRVLGYMAVRVCLSPGRAHT